MSIRSKYIYLFFKTRYFIPFKTTKAPRLYVYNPHKNAPKVQGNQARIA